MRWRAGGAHGDQTWQTRPPLRTQFSHWPPRPILQRIGRSMRLAPPGCTDPLMAGPVGSPPTAVSSLQSDLVTSAVAVSPDFVRDRTVFAGCSGGIVCSYDAGQTWHVITLPTPPSIVSCLAFSPSYADDGVAFLGTMEDGVYRSADRGQNWARWNFGLFDLRVLALAVSPDFSHDETVFAGTETGIYISKSGGRSWRPLLLPDEAAPVMCLAVSPGFAQDGILWAGTDSAGLWASADRGKTWRRSGEEALRESVNALIVSQRSSSEPATPGAGDGGITPLARWRRNLDLVGGRAVGGVGAGGSRRAGGRRGHAPGGSGRWSRHPLDGLSG